MASGSMDGARFVDWETGRRSELRGFGKPKREGARRKGNFAERAVAEPTRRLGNQASGACTRRTQDPGNRGLRVWTRQTLGPAQPVSRESAATNSSLGQLSGGLADAADLSHGALWGETDAKAGSSCGQLWGERVGHELIRVAQPSRWESRGMGESSGKPSDKPVKTKSPFFWVTEFGVTES